MATQDPHRFPRGRVASRAVDPREVLTRPAAPPAAVVRYGEHPEQVLDVYLPRTPDRGPASVVVVLHGGFWRQQYDRTHVRPMAEALAGEGFVVVVPEYRRSGGDGGWPHTFDDVASALAAVPTLADAAPGQAMLDEPPTLVGHSAGGHLAMWAVLGRGVPARRVVALAPVADLTEAYARGLGEGAVAALMGCSPQEAPEVYAAADPARRLPPPEHTPPITILHGVEDDRVPVDLCRPLPGVRLVELPGVEHFGLIDPLSRAWPHVLHAIRETGSPAGGQR